MGNTSADFSSAYVAALRVISVGLPILVVAEIAGAD
jgi:hypothetical protein